MGHAATDPGTQGWLVAILELGAWVGVLLSGYLADKLSRKYTIVLGMSSSRRQVECEFDFGSYSCYRVLHWCNCPNRGICAIINFRR